MAEMISDSSRMFDRELQHRRAQRLLVHDDLDELAAARRIAEHADHLVVGREQNRKGMHDGAVPGRVAHVDFVIDRRRHVADHQQAALAAHLHGDGARADRVEHLPGQMVGHVRRRLQHQRGGVGVAELVAEPIQSVIRDRRHIDQHFRDHHEQDREDEELVGQAKPRGEPLLQAGPVLASVWSVVWSMIDRGLSSRIGSSSLIPAQRESVLI